MLQEFKEFINKGNVVDLAVAVVMAAAFAPVVNAVVDRVLMPIIGLLFDTPNFDSLGTFACDPDAAAGAEGLINGCAGSVGAVITAIINFLLIAFAVFLVVKAYNRMNRAEEESVEDPEDVQLLREIRDSLQAQNR